MPENKNGTEVPFDGPFIESD